MNEYEKLNKLFDLDHLNKENFFDNIYDEFFGVLSKKNKKDLEYLDRETKDLPKIDIPKEEETINNKEENKTVENKNATEEQKNNENSGAISKEKALEEKNKFKDAVDTLLLDEQSKEYLKKMIIYAYNYYLGYAKNYIPFDMCIYSDDEDTRIGITNFIKKVFYTFNYIRNDKKGNVNFYEVEDIRQIDEIYSRKLGVITFSNIKVLNSIDNNDRKKILNSIENNIQNNCKDNTEATLSIIYGNDKQEVKQILDQNELLRDKIFDFELQTIPEDSQTVYQKVIMAIDENNYLDDNFRIKLLEYVTETYPKTNLSASDYKEKLVEQILFNKTGYTINEETIPSFEKQKSNEEIFKELNELIGLDNVKQMLKDLVSLIEFKKKAPDDIKVKDTNLHMVFLGNPGTGKTTVARMIAEILYNLKYIEQNKLIEVSAKDLIGQYVGQTAPKTMEVIERALGGVLFIDEAYSLASKSPSGNSFNEECIATLIQAMENYRDRLIVIFAGYTKEMDTFLKSNSGIISRIGYTIEFKDYTIDELIQIEESLFKKAGFKVKDEALEKSKEIILKYKNTEGFGNARFVRNLYEKTVIKHAANTKSKKNLTVLKTITADDITDENISKLD